MKRTKMSVVAVLALAILVALSAIGQAAPITLKLAYILTPASPQTKGVFKFADLVDQYTQGQVKVKVYHSGMLGSDERQIMEGMKLGTIDMTNGTVGVLSAFIPKFQVLDMPFLFRDYAHVDKVLDGEIGQELLDLMPAVGFKGLAFFEIGFRNVSNSKRPINSAEDMRGLKFRLPQIPPYVEMFKELGAIPVPMAWGEVYMALKTGTVDGQDNGPSHTYTQKTYEANQKYYSVINYAYGAGIIMISNQSWDKIPKNLQPAVIKAARDAAKYERELIRSEDALCLNLLEEAGVEVNRNPDINGFRAAAERVYATMSKQPWYDAKLIERIKSVK